MPSRGCGPSRRPSRTHPRDRVRRAAGEERPGAFTLKRARREPRRGAQGERPEPRDRERMRGQRAQRPEHRGLELPPVLGERLDQAPVRLFVRIERRGGLGDRALEHDRRSVVERMGERRIRLHEVEAVRRERQLAEDRRSGEERVDRRADVVDEARERELVGVSAAAGRFLRLPDEHPLARAASQLARRTGACSGQRSVDVVLTRIFQESARNRPKTGTLGKLRHSLRRRVEDERTASVLAYCRQPNAFPQPLI